MNSYNELITLIDAVINRNGVQAITGQVLNGVLKAMVQQLGAGYSLSGVAHPTDDPGTPEQPVCYFASEVGTYTNFGGVGIVAGELALLCYDMTDGWFKETMYEGFASVGATIDGNVGTPSVDVTYNNGVLSFDFRNLKGNPGEDGNDGQDGAAAGFGTITASVDANVGTPSVAVTESGPDTAKNLAFAFHNLKGADGEPGVTSVNVTVDNTSGSPACAVSLNAGVLTLAFTGLKGAQGDTGSSVDYPFTIANNLTTDDATQALSAAQGVVLEGEISQLEAKVDGVFGNAADDFSITDDNGYAIVKFSGGHIQTKNFDSANIDTGIPDNAVTETKIASGAVTSSKIADNAVTQSKIADGAVGKDKVTEDIPYIDSGSVGDFQITDAAGNAILQLSGGHIKTKNFDSATIKGEPTSVLYDEIMTVDNNPDIVLTNANFSTDGIVLTTGSSESSALLNRQYGLARRCMRAVVKFSSGSILKIGAYNAQSGSNETDFFLVDSDNKTISYYFNNTLQDTETIAFFDVSHPYVVEYRKHYQHISLKVIDAYSGDSGELVMVSNGDSTGKNSTVGMIHDDFKLFADTSGVASSTILIKRISVVSEIVNPKLLMYGSSTSEPEGYYPTTDFDSSWTQLIISQLNGDAVSSGRGGGQIWGVSRRIVNELPYIHAKYVMITIGANGGLTEDNLTELCNYIISQGSIPLINHIACNDGGTASQTEVNPIVDAVRAKLNLVGANFDECTSIDGDGVTLDPTTMWPNLVKIHPNVEGSKRMVAQIRKDLPFLFM